LPVPIVSVEKGKEMGKGKEIERTIITPTLIPNPPGLKIGSPILSLDKRPTRGE
jgi:hypothetical protein